MHLLRIATRAYFCFTRQSMNNNTLENELLTTTTALCEALANDPQVISATASIRLFFQNPEATKLFEEVNAYGEELRNKHLAGMPPSEEEITKFDTLREAVVANDTARNYLEARQSIDCILGSISQHLGMSIDLGRAPTLEEVEAASKQAASATCSCGSDGNCENCEDGNCEKEHCDCK
ncbi:MAG: YlbF family regulator [Akkermansia sp.]